MRCCGSAYRELARSGYRYGRNHIVAAFADVITATVLAIRADSRAARRHE
jgi:hypothetical protein